MKLPEAIKNLADELSELPSIGPRQAMRLAFYLVGRGEQNIRGLAKSVDDLRQIKTCERCFFVHQNKDGLCDICRNPARKQSIIVIVEKETDLISLENTGKFTGRYLILGEIPKTGLMNDWQKLRLQNLKSFIEKELPGKKAEEIVLAFNPTSLGDFHASLITKELEPFSKKISRLGRGLPTGGEIEFADDETLGSALEKRG
ncbi:MAG: toprim domain-containing protein [Patescibacteria group bacterium]|nr:toprim domain-containing protein [Patescibacteria group bacterium]MDE2015624.1 toprim domain-containing protein [Patescibacteria group bacterium]MDE2226681.1 toprim domain-containing protein [Patescibacteria group bacterium]